MKTRQQIIDEAKRIRAECQQIITDCNHWNENVRKPHEGVIDPDPDGMLRRTIDRIDKMLANEIRICEPPVLGE